MVSVDNGHLGVYTLFTSLLVSPLKSLFMFNAGWVEVRVPESLGLGHKWMQKGKKVKGLGRKAYFWLSFPSQQGTVD